MASTGAIRAAQAYVELFIDNNKLMAGLKLAETELHNFGSKVQSFGQNIVAIGMAASLPVGAAIKNFMSFDDTMRAVQGVTGATGDQFDKLTEKAKYLGRTTSFSATDVASAMLELGRAGFKTDQIDSAIGNVMNLSRATQTDIPRATEIASMAMNGFCLTADDMGRICDVLAATANNSAQTVDDVGEALSYVAPIANDAGLSIEDMCKVLGILANFGIKGSMAGTSVKNILTRMADPAIQEQYKALGVSVTDAAGNLRNMSDVLLDVGKATDGLPNAEKLALFQNLFDMRALSAGAKLTGESFQSMIDAIDNASGEAGRVAGVMDSGIGGAFRGLMSAVEGVGNAFGSALSDSLSVTFKCVADALNFITELINSNQNFIVILSRVISATIATGAALIALGMASKLVSMAIGGMRTSLMSVMKFGMSPFKMIASAIGFILSPAWAAVAAIAAIGFAAFQIYKYRDAIPGMFQEGMSVAKSAASTISSAVVSAFSAVKSAAGTVFGGLVNVVSGVAGVIGRAFSGVMTFLSGLWKGIGGFLSGIGDFFSGFSSGVSDALSGAFSFFGELVQWLKGRFSALAGFCTGAFSAIADALASGNITAAAKMLWASLKMLWEAGCFSILTFWYTICFAMEKAWTNTVYFLASIFVKGFYNVQIWWSKFITGIANLWSGVCNYVAGIWDSTMKAVEKAIAKAYAFATGQTDEETMNILAEIDAKYQAKADERQKKYENNFDQRNNEAQKTQDQLSQDKNGVLDMLGEDQDSRMKGIENDFNRKNEANLNDFENAKAEYNAAMENAKKPKEETEEDNDKDTPKPNEKKTAGLKIGGIDFGSIVPSDFSAQDFDQFGLGHDLNDVMDNAPETTQSAAEGGSDSAKKGSFRASELEGATGFSWMKRNSEDQLQTMRDIRNMMMEGGEYL